MKLNKLQFARLTGFCAANGMTIDDWSVEKLDELIDVQVPQPEPYRADATAVNELLMQIASPNGYISAIKAYRALTGAGLKESKEAIDRYRSFFEPAKVKASYANAGGDNDHVVY